MTTFGTFSELDTYVMNFFSLYATMYIVCDAQLACSARIIIACEIQQESAS